MTYMPVLKGEAKAFKSMNNKPQIQIRAPRFELYELVTLHWNGTEHSTKIVRRWFDLDDGSEGYWWYKVAGDDQQFYPEGALEPRRE